MCGLCYDIGLCNVLAIALDWNIPGQVECASSLDG